MRNIFILLVVGIVILMITSCSNETQPEPTPAQVPTPTPTITEEEQTPTKSDTQQIIDNVLAFIEAESKREGQSAYWYNGYDGYEKFKWGENYPDKPNYQSDAYHITRLLKVNHDSEYPVDIAYDFPNIQDEFAVFDISFTQDYGFSKVKSVFRFNLIDNKGWKITDLRLIYTDSQSFKQYVSY